MRRAVGRLREAPVRSFSRRPPRRPVERGPQGLPPPCEAAVSSEASIRRRPRRAPPKALQGPSSRSPESLDDLAGPRPRTAPGTATACAPRGVARRVGQRASRAASSSEPLRTPRPLRGHRRRRAALRPRVHLHRRRPTSHEPVSAASALRPGILDELRPALPDRAPRLGRGAHLHTRLPRFTVVGDFASASSSRARARSSAWPRPCPSPARRTGSHPSDLLLRIGTSRPGAPARAPQLPPLLRIEFSHVDAPSTCIRYATARAAFTIPWP